MAVTLLLWASAFVAIRHLGRDVPPGALSLGRLLVASVALGVLVFRRPRTWPAARDWPLLLLCGVGWFGIYNLALNEAERRIDAGTSALIVQIGPIIVALLATVFLGEKMSRWLLIGMAVGFAGVVVIARGFSSGDSGDMVGVWLAVLAAVTYAVGVLAQKPLLGRLPGPEVTWLACIIGAVVCLPWTGELVTVVRDSDASTLWWIAYLGIFPTAIAFSTWAYVPGAQRCRHADPDDLPRALHRDAHRLGAALRGASTPDLRRWRPVHRRRPADATQAPGHARRRRLRSSNQAALQADRATSGCGQPFPKCRTCVLLEESATRVGGVSSCHSSTPGARRPTRLPVAAPSTPRVVCSSVRRTPAPCARSAGLAGLAGRRSRRGAFADRAARGPEGSPRGPDRRRVRCAALDRGAGSSRG